MPAPLAAVIALLTFVPPHPTGEGDLGVELGLEDDLVSAELLHSFTTCLSSSR